MVIANQVIEHLYNTDTFIKEVWRILKVGGYAMISTPNLASFHSVVFLLLGFQPLTAFVSDEVRVGNPLYSIAESGTSPAGAKYPAHSHLRVFTMNALKGLCQHHGFNIAKAAGVGYYPFVGKVAKFMSHLDGKHSAYLVIKVRKSK